MIPLKLRLSNFMCYRSEQSLDFSGIHLACLAGDNGHGKSALLDAITWALWGRARGDRDDELITLGETEMWVDFEFGLGGQRYRVWRQRSKKGRGQSDLHFYVWNASPLPAQGGGGGAGQLPAEGEGAGGDWQLLDEGNLRERQAQITRTLRMEYETFVNSAFLLQGRADSFTVKTASERKQILADILGLSRYDLYEQRAKDEIQARKEQATRLSGEIAALDAELGQRAAYEDRLHAARAAVAQATLALKDVEAAHGAARLAAQERQGQARQLADLRSRLARVERELAEGEGQLGAAQARLAQFETILAQREEIEAGWAALQAARAEDAGWNERLVHHAQANEAISQAQLAVDQARLALETELRRLRQRQTELAGKIAQGDVQAAHLAEAQDALAQFSQQQARRDLLSAELRSLSERSATLRHDLDRIKAEGQAVKDKTDLLATAEAAACPLCQRPLDAEHLARMLADFAAEREALAARYRTDQATLKTLDKERQALEAEDAELVRALRGRDARQRQAAQAEAAITEAQAAAIEQEQLANQTATLAAQLGAADFAPAQHVRLTQAQAARAAIGYDASAHQRVRALAQELAAFEARYSRQLLPAQDGVAEARERVAVLAGQQTRRAAEIRADRAEADRLAAAIADLPGLEAELKRAEGEVARMTQVERRARLEEGAAHQQIDALTAVAERRAARGAALETLNTDISLYTQLREAFGKKGVQAMIIESAIPEVEAEANRLLARMSEGRMSLRLETQREKVTGGVAETLDIIIADELGSRSYDLFSGGESFRANLALRIAISKLLARRAGAQLQTLVIDEGFGSQDAQGRALVVEAINSIQHDFERIIVITHIEELKDLFPARIDVVKGPDGTRVALG